MSQLPGSESSSTPPEQAPSDTPPPTYSQPPADPPAPAYPTAPTTQLPPVPTQPMPAPPTYDPAAVAAQYSTPPASGPYGYLAMGAPPAPPKKRVAIVALSVLTAVFVLASGALGTLFVLKNREASDLSGQVAQLNNTVDSTQKELETTKRNLKDSDAEVANLTTQKKAMADCLNGIYDYWHTLDATNGTNTPATDAAAKEADRLCNLADKYLAVR